MGKEKSQILLIFYSSLFFIVFFLKGRDESILTYLTWFETTLYYLKMFLRIRDNIGKVISDAFWPSPVRQFKHDNVWLPKPPNSVFLPLGQVLSFLITPPPQTHLSATPDIFSCFLDMASSVSGQLMQTRCWFTMYFSLMTLFYSMGVGHTTPHSSHSRLKI